MAVYANYDRVNLDGGMGLVVDGYLGGYAHMFATKTRMQLKYAPTMIVVDLRTMKILASGQVDPSEAIRKCKQLPD